MDYIYAVARVRSKELSLFTSFFIEQLIATKSHAECLALLKEKGWGSPDANDDEEAMLSYERDKTWDFIKECVKDDMGKFDVFLYANDYHNLKAAIKSVCLIDKDEPEHIYMDYGTVSKDVIFNAVKNKEFEKLPEAMREAAQKAYETLLHTADGQLCECIVDKAALNAIYEAGKQSDNETVKIYAEHTVATANIKTAYRCCLMNKSYDFIYDSLGECDTLDIKRLAKAAANLDALCEYLAATPYSAACEKLRESASAFERWCDNGLIEKIKPQKYVTYSVGPLAAYLIARENEIKTVRIILACKLNGFDETIIRERLREMYV